MKRIFVLILTFVIMCTVFGCENKEVEKQGEDNEYKQITQEEAKKMMEEEDVIILDVRTKGEYESGHIKGAILLELDDIKLAAEEKLPNKNIKLLVYCRSGNRSKQASRTLVELGYANVYEFGGIITWEYDLEK